MLEANNNQLEAAFAVARNFANQNVPAEFGHLISDDLCRRLSKEIAEAVLAIPSTPPKQIGDPDA